MAVLESGEVSAGPGGGMPPLATGGERKGKKVVVVRRAGSTSSSAVGTPRGGASPTPPAATLPAGKTVSGAERLERKRAAGRLRRHDVLGGVGAFEAELAASAPPPSPPAEPLNRHTYDLGRMPPEVVEAAMIAPDNGVAVINAFETLLASRAGMTTRATQMRTTRQGAGTADLYGTRTWGNNYPEGHPTGRLMEERRVRALARWEETQRAWAANEEALVATTGQPASSLAMSKHRAVEYRTALQTKTQLMKAVPLADKGLGPAQWAMSLRDGWTRYVQIGNVFSGLFVHIEERPADAPGANLRPIEMVQQLDLDRPGTPSASMSTRAKLDTLRDVSLTARGRAWAQGGYLKYRKKLYAQNLKLVVPQEPEFGELHVKGVGVEQAMWERANAAVTIQDVEDQLAREDPEALASLQSARAEEEARLQAEEEARRQALIDLMEKDKSRPREGPSVFIAEPRLVMVAEAGEVSRASLCVQNNGSTALSYTWSGKMRDLPKNAKAGGTYDVERFYLSDQSGVLLPRQVKYFDFSFKSDQPGIYEAKWSLATHPQLPDPAGPVTLRGVASTRDTSKFRRRLLDADLNERVKAEQVGVALERILRNVVTPPLEPEEAPTDEQAAAMATFYALNNERPGPPLYFRPDLHAAMGELYEHALALLHPEPTEEELAEQVAKAAKGGKGGKESKSEEAETEFPPQWSGQVEALEQLVGQLAQAEVVQGEAAAAAGAKLEALLDQARVPAARGQMHQHAMRSIVKRMGDAVADVAEETLAEAVRREAERDEAEDEAEGGSKKPPPPAKGKKGVPPPPKYNKEEFIELLEGAAKGGVLSAGGHFQRAVLDLSRAAADHLDAKIAGATEALASSSSNDEAAGLAWDKFALLRTRRDLRLPGGHEAWRPGEEVQLEFSDDEAEGAEEEEREEMEEAGDEGAATDEANEGEGDEDEEED